MKKLVLFACVLSTSFLMAGEGCGCGKKKPTSNLDSKNEVSNPVQPKPAEQPAPAITPTAADATPPAITPASTES
ncbi:MAG: hypothetical protein JSS30_00680 [Verrucomicrobia bacterium]|nr:hypothetical protein [Verrucomicrobiota bacterium]